MAIYYISEVADRTNFTALNKARSDVEYIFNLRGYKKLYSYINIINSKEANTRFIYEIIKLFFSLKANDSVYFQYPYYERRNKMRRIVTTLTKRKNINLIAVIHDIDALRYARDKKSVLQEINYLNKFNYLISHNPKMTTWLKNHGCKVNIIDLNLFDYIVENPIEYNNERKSDLVFAGNLDKEKSAFIYKLIEENNITAKINLYGPNFAGDLKNNSICYKGMFKADELLNNLEGKYGLIWDGEDLDKCTGNIGEYTKYNNPHKLSMYIAAQIPVISWEKMAISTFIKEYNIGFTIRSLEDLEVKMNSITDTEYNMMLNNIKELQSKVIKGEFMDMALTKIDNDIT